MSAISEAIKQQPHDLEPERVFEALLRVWVLAETALIGEFCGGSEMAAAEARLLSDEDEWRECFKSAMKTVGSL